MEDAGDGDAPNITGYNTSHIKGCHTKEHTQSEEVFCTDLSTKLLGKHW